MTFGGKDLNVDQNQRHRAKTKVEWCAWYRSPTWKAIKRHRLAEEPFCRCCAQEGRAVAAIHVDHIEHHSGQWGLFVSYENTQSLCYRHHADRKRRRRAFVD
jgi:5-methylcytosine-specific restriction protein A